MPPVAEIAYLDFSSFKPGPAAVKAAGYTGVALYLPVSGRRPETCATKEEAAAYLAAGLDVVAIFETTANRAAAGAAAGSADAATAEAAADEWGYPVEATIFWTVDYDAQPVDYPVLRDYGTGFDGGTRRPAGVYGPHLVLDALVTPGQRPIRYGWQAAGWNRPGGLSANAYLCQRVGHPNWPVIGAPNSTDENVLCKDLPVWAGAGAPAAEPAAPPAPAPAPAPAADDGPYIPPTGHDLTGDGDELRGHIGDAGPRVAELQHELHDEYPAYAGNLPETGFYGHQTAGVLEEFSHRAAVEHDEPDADRQGLHDSDGEDLGPRTAAALHRHGLI